MEILLTRYFYPCLLFECAFCNLPVTIAIETSVLVLQIESQKTSVYVVLNTANRRNSHIKRCILQSALVPTSLLYSISHTKQLEYFIALIHPIQWTIAYPVGTDRPAKRQKKTSCVSTGRSVQSTSALARWHVVLPSCLDSVTS